MSAVIKFFDGYKTYIVAAAGVVVGVLIITGVTTPDQLKGWGEVVGQGIVLAGLALAGLRSAIKKLET